LTILIDRDFALLGLGENCDAGEPVGDRRFLFVLLFPIPPFVPVDAQGGFVLMCGYTGKEVVG
jgi:hypothetical protein